MGTRRRITSTQYGPRRRKSHRSGRERGYGRARAVWKECKPLIEDERGGLSAARSFFVAWSLIVVYAGFWREPYEGFWPVAGSVLLGLLAWAAGPRMASYLAPQIGEVARGIADSIGKKRNKDDPQDPLY